MKLGVFQKVMFPARGFYFSGTTYLRFGTNEISRYGIYNKKYKSNTHWKHKMKGIQIKKEVKTINTNERGRRRRGWDPGGRGGTPRPPPYPFICIDRFHFFFICIPFILCFQCVFDLYLLLYFPIFPLIFHISYIF